MTSKEKPFYFRNQVTTFVILFAGRVGSTHLINLLDSHPHILAHHDEITNIKDKGAAEQLKLAEEYLTPPLVGPNKAIGFKTKTANILDLDGFTRLITEKNCKIIYLLRRNRIKSAVSHINGKRLAEATGMWGLFDESKRLPPFAIDLEEFDKVLRNREKVDQELEAYINSLPLPNVQICYEDLLKDQKMVLDPLFEYLEVAPHTVQSSTLKITKDNLREELLNFDELRAKYAGTPYEPMFDEVIA
jgi:LPS sulfotransferase NodH